MPKLKLLIKLGKTSLIKGQETIIDDCPSPADIFRNHLGPKEKWSVREGGDLKHIFATVQRLKTISALMCINARMPMTHTSVCDPGKL